MQTELSWFDELSAEQSSLVGLMVQYGVQGLSQWLLAPDDGLRIGTDVFATAPGDMARVVSLARTVELVRVAVTVTEESIGDLADGPDQVWLREAMLRYSREIAFAAALVYARAAEQRGAWDARLEALVVDAVVRGDVDDALLTRAAALGWAQPSSVTVIAGYAPSGDPEPLITALHQRGAAVGAEILGGVQAERLVAIVGTGRRLTRVIRALLPVFDGGPVVLGPQVAGLAEAGRSAHSALSGLRAVSAWPSAPRPVSSEDLLPERVLAGDNDARVELVSRLYRPLRTAPLLLETADAYLLAGGSIEATAKALWVHPNTVRYRLTRIGELLALDMHASRARLALQLALTIGRLADAAL